MSKRKKVKFPQLSMSNHVSINKSDSPDSAGRKKPGLLQDVQGFFHSFSKSLLPGDEAINGKTISYTVKARELKYNLQEWILIKSIVFSLIVFLTFVMLTRFILDLAGSYLPVLVLSALTSIALRPTTDNLSSKVKEFFGVKQSEDHHISFVRKSVLVSIYRTIRELWNYKTNKQPTKRRKEKISKFIKEFLVTDVYPMLLICGCWILVTRFGMEIVGYIVGIFLVADVFFRLIFDFLTFIFKQIGLIRSISSDSDKSERFRVFIDSTVATLVALGFIILSLGICIFLCILLFMDIETIVVNLRSSIVALIQSINQKVSEYAGVENAIDENFIGSFVQNYNESIYSFLSKNDLGGIYYLASGKNNVTASFPDFPAIAENSTEFKECIAKNRINYDWDFLRYLEAAYCSIAVYAKNITIDPFTTLKKVREGLSFVLQIIFGTILFEFYLFSKAALDYIFMLMIFFFGVYYLLHADKSIIYTATTMLPLNPEIQVELHDNLVKSIKGSFVCSIRIFFDHFVITWLAFDILQLRLGFTISIAASVFSILPFMPPWVLCVPHAVYMYLSGGNLITSIAFPVVYFLVSNKIYNDIYTNTIGIHPYVTGLSIVLGIYAFDLQGIIYGPLLMCTIVIVYQLLKKYGVSTDTMLKLYGKRVLIEQMESLKKQETPTDLTLAKQRSKSFEKISTPEKYKKTTSKARSQNLNT